MFYIVDKPVGMTSFDVIRGLRRSLGTKKMGHIGTLDPFATGLMVIATEKSTKLIPLLEGSKKEYILQVMLDGVTDSLDRETPIISTSMEGYIARSDEDIRTFLRSQKSQIPPLYSALHIDGKRAYERVRRGEIFEMKPRQIEVFDVEILSRSLNSLDIRIILSSGGYVRSFAPLLGSYLGVKGGYLSLLRRTRIFTEYGVIEIPKDKENAGVSYRSLFQEIPHMMIDEDHLKKLRDGKIVETKEIVPLTIKNGYIFLANRDETFVSLCSIENDTLKIIRNDVGDL